MVPLREKRFEITRPMFNGSAGMDIHLWRLHDKAVSRGKDLIKAIEGELVEMIITQKALSIIISDLGDIMLRQIQDCETAHSIWIKLHHRYAGKSTINKLFAFNNI